MKKGFIAFVLAASVALTGFSAAPARADSDDIAKVLLGLLVIGAIAKAAENDDPAPVTRRQPQPRVQYLPQRCLRPFSTNRGTRYGFAAGCLDRHARNIHVPVDCERRGLNQHGRTRTFYAEACMARYGYRTHG